jgi:tetraacyldisaccharide 4'-kinase
VFTSSIATLEVKNLTAETLPKQPVVALCGIANPWGFIQTLGSAGYQVAAQYFFQDHYHFNLSEITKIEQRHPSLPLVCTEKDWVKLSQMNLQQLYCAAIKVALTSEQEFNAMLLNAVSQQTVVSSSRVVYST